MTRQALEALWMCKSQLELCELQYWKIADEFIDQGVTDIYDVAVIYGVCADTARKRLRDFRKGDYPQLSSPPAAF